jgi:hypothetical protein
VGHLAATAARVRSNALTGTDLDIGFRVASGRGAHALLDLAGHGQEGLLDIAGILGRCLEEGDSEAVRELLRHSIFDNLLVRHIALVAYEQLVDAIGGVAINLLKPLLHVVEGVHIGDIVDDADTVSPSVIRTGNGPETLLAGSIPNLELYCLAIELYRSDFKINADCGNVRFRVGIIRKPQEKAGLSDTRVSDKEELEEVIVFRVHDDGLSGSGESGRGR